MIRTLRLHGALGAELGREFRFWAESPAELVRALCRMVPGARARLEAGAYSLRRSGRERVRVDDVDSIPHRFRAEEAVWHVFPRAAGASRGRGIGKIVLGIALVGVSFALPGAGLLGGLVTPSSVFGFGASLVLGGVSSLLAPRPRSAARQNDARETSSLFGDQQNNADPGAPIPVVVGVCEVGSVVVSAAVHVEDRN